MPNFRLPAAVAAVALLPGCITFYSKSEVIRGDEARRPVRFETTEAGERFQTALNGHSRHVGGTYLGVPFVTLYSRDRSLSENAAFNDAVARCDTDQDGVITQVEAETFAKHP